MGKGKLFVCAAAVLITVCMGALSSQSQSVQINNGGNSVTCPTADNFASGMTCYSATLANCSNAQNLTFYYGYELPSQPTPNGTIVLFPGGTGTNASPETENKFAGDYLTAGYEVVELAWTMDWEDATNGTTGPPYSSIGAAACRINTFLYHVYTHSLLYSGGGMCVQGISAGAGAAAYALAWYSAPSFVDKVELLSGPVFSDIGQGCEVCATCPPSATVCNGSPSWCQLGTQMPWTLSLNYTDHPLNSVRMWTDTTNNLGCYCRGSSNTSSSCNSNWTV